MAERTDPSAPQKPPPPPSSSPTLHEAERRDASPGEDHPAARRPRQEVGPQGPAEAEAGSSPLIDTAQAALQQVSASATQIAAQGRAAVSQVEKTLEDTIREQPLQMLLIAAGVGLVIGLLIKK